MNACPDNGWQVPHERHLQDVVSGVALYDKGAGSGWVMTSEMVCLKQPRACGAQFGVRTNRNIPWGALAHAWQGGSGFSLFGRLTNQYVGRFQVRKKIAGFVQRPLGLAATSAPVPGYFRGVWCRRSIAGYFHRS
jgi:hypothetical protein